MNQHPAGGDLNDIVFETRNKAYGAYALRKDSDNRVILSFFLSSSFLLLVVLTPHLWGKFNKSIVPPEVILPPDSIQVVEIDLTVTKELKIPEKKSSGEKAAAPVLALAPVIEEQMSDTAENIPVEEWDGSADTSGTADNTSGEDYTGSGRNEKQEDREGPRVSADVMPEFPGGKEQLVRYLRRNIVYPPAMLKEGAEGVVYAYFIIDENGNVAEAGIKHGTGKSFDQEAIRVLKNMPKWKPGAHDGRPVKVIHTIPVNFKIY